MTERWVPRVQTHTAPVELYTALRGAWTGLIGSEPSRASLLVLLAHWALETGFGAACWNWNLGNVKHVKGDGRDYFGVRHNEIVNGKTIWLDADDTEEPKDPFRAFHGLAEGVSDYLGILRGQFGFAWPAVEAGDAASFCHALRQRGYYTSDEALYTAGVMRCYHQLDASIPIDPEPVAAMHPEFVPPDPTDSA